MVGKQLRRFLVDRTPGGLTTLDIVTTGVWWRGQLRFQLALKVEPS